MGENIKCSVMCKAEVLTYISDRVSHTFQPQVLNNLGLHCKLTNSTIVNEQPLWE